MTTTTIPITARLQQITSVKPSSGPSSNLSRLSTAPETMKNRPRSFPSERDGPAYFVQYLTGYKSSYGQFKDICTSLNAILSSLTEKDLKFIENGDPMML